MILVNKNHVSNAIVHSNGCSEFVTSVCKLYYKAFIQIKKNPAISLNSLKKHTADRFFNDRTINKLLSVLYGKNKSILKSYYREYAYFFVKFLKIFNEFKIKEILIAPYYSHPDIDKICYALEELICSEFEIFCQKDEKSKLIYNKNFIVIINAIFDYDTFCKGGFKNKHGKNWDAYQLATLLDVRVCPYCNRNFTLTVKRSKTIENKKDKICRPQFDHFLPKSKYIFIALSYYNLIPSCTVCNHIKSSKNIEPSHFIHPYFEDFGTKGRFILSSLGNGGHAFSADYEFNMELLGEKITTNNETFFLKEIYKHHTNYINDVIERIKMSGSDLIGYLKDHYKSKGVIITDKNVETFLFPEIKDPSEFHNYPLSKFLYDVYNEYKRINKLV